MSLFTHNLVLTETVTKHKANKNAFLSKAYCRLSQVNKFKQVAGFQVNKCVVWSHGGPL